MKKYGYMIISLFCLLCLTGCGRQVAEDVQENQTAADWKTNGFAVSGEVVEEQALWVNSYIPWEHEDLTWDEETETVSWVLRRIFYGDSQAICCGEKLYMLLPIIDAENYNYTRWFLEIYDTASMEASFQELDLNQLEISKAEGTRKFLWDMDVMGDQAFAFQVLDIDINETDSGTEFNHISNAIVYLDSEGKVSQTELLPFFQEKGYVGKGTSSEGVWSSDAAGNIYLRIGTAANPYLKLYILGSDGELLMEHECAAQEQIYAPMKTVEGELIFPVRNNETRSTSLVWFDVTKKQAHALAVLEGEYVKQLYGMQGNDLFYENGFGIVRWNVVSGIRQQVFRFDQNGVSDSLGTMLVLREGRTPVLRLWGTVNDETKDLLVTLSEEPVERPDAIRVVSLTEESQRVRNSVPAVSRQNPNNTFVYEERETTDAEDYRNRIIAELAAGDGPEIMYVSREDMEILYERGVLADLRDFISEETLDKVLPGVLEMGTVDGSLVGMAPGIRAISLRVGENAWSEDSWTLEDILGLMESGKLERRIFYTSTGGYFGPLAVMGWLIDYSLEDSFLIDWETGESHFEDERFIRLLEYISRNDDLSYDGPIDDRIQGGGSLMVFEEISEPYAAAQFVGTHGVQGSHYVGFPTEHGNGNYLEAAGVIVVRKNVSNPSAVSSYLECLLGNEIQMTSSLVDSYGLPVIPLPTDSYRIDPDTGKAWWDGRTLNIFEDGTNSLQEANAFLAQCVPAPKTYTVLQDIIDEELSVYYHDGRSAEETANIIDNRVQLYLDEGN